MNRFICYFVCGHACANMANDVLFICHAFHSDFYTDQNKAKCSDVFISNIYTYIYIDWNIYIFVFATFAVNTIYRYRIEKYSLYIKLLNGVVFSVFFFFISFFFLITIQVLNIYIFFFLINHLCGHCACIKWQTITHKDTIKYIIEF